jgi:hypothetical protein
MNAKLSNLLRDAAAGRIPEGTEAREALGLIMLESWIVDEIEAGSTPPDIVLEGLDTVRGMIRNLGY